MHPKLFTQILLSLFLFAATTAHSGIDTGGANTGTEGAVAGVIEGIDEGGTEGAVAGVIEGIDEGGTEGINEGGTEGIDEGGTEGIDEGGIKGAVAGVIEGIDEGGTEGIDEGGTEGIDEGGTEGAVAGVIEGIDEGGTEGIDEGGTEGIDEGGTEGAVAGVIEGIDEGGTEGIDEGGTEGIDEGGTEGAVAGVIEGIDEGGTEGIDEGGTEGIDEGGTEGAVAGVIEGIDEGGTEGIDEGGTEGIDQGGTEGAVAGVIEGIDEGGTERIVQVLRGPVRTNPLSINEVPIDYGRASISRDGNPMSAMDLRDGQVATVVGHLSAGNMIADTINLTSALTGQIEKFDSGLNAISLLGHTVMLDSTTVLNDLQDIFTTGTWVVVDGKSLDAVGRIQATRISATNNQRVEITGTVSAIDPSGLVFYIGEQRIDVSMAGVIDLPTGMPQEGQYLSISGDLIKNGNFIRAIYVRNPELR